MGRLHDRRSERAQEHRAGVGLLSATEGRFASGFAKTKRITKARKTKTRKRLGGVYRFGFFRVFRLSCFRDEELELRNDATASLDF
jgi:hypothetical protein